ncbi:MAG: FtsH protease activity modulator HflK [candidate division Zixibacteria bacterium]|nr:FtsH protease activity modulator HflK [candidate division Zixibacteria bacterium]
MSNRIRKLPSLWISAAVVLLYLLSGLFSLDSGQHGIVTRFGKVIRIAADPGINYHLPYPFETVEKIRVSQVQKLSIEGSNGYGLECFTGDENLILVRAVLSFDVKDLLLYRYNVQDIKAMLESAAKMCISGEVASRNVDDVMTVGKSLMRLVIKDRIQQSLDKLQSGVRIISVELTDISPPPNVSRAFKAVSDAREKKQKIIKEAEGYSNSTVPKARGEAKSITTNARAEAEEIVKLANARAEAFNALYEEYRKSPLMTSNLRYLETVKKIYDRCQVYTDPQPSRSIYYIDKDRFQKTPADTISQDGGGRNR